MHTQIHMHHQNIIYFAHHCISHIVNPITFIFRWVNSNNTIAVPVFKKNQPVVAQLAQTDMGMDNKCCWRPQVLPLPMVCTPYTRAGNGLLTQWLTETVIYDSCLPMTAIQNSVSAHVVLWIRQTTTVI